MLRLSPVPLPAALRRMVRAAREHSSKVPSRPGPSRRERLQDQAAGRARTREDELLETLPGVVRYRARLALVRDDLLPAAARDANLRMTAEALEAAGIAYGLVPDGGPAHRVVIAPGGRSAVLEACAAAFAGRAVYARLLGDGELGDVLAERLPHAVATTETDPQAKVKGICLFNAS